MLQTLSSSKTQTRDAHCDYYNYLYWSVLCCYTGAKENDLICVSAVECGVECRNDEVDYISDEEFNYYFAA